jgi:hypothetical protein
MILRGALAGSQVQRQQITRTHLPDPMKVAGKTRTPQRARALSGEVAAAVAAAAVAAVAAAATAGPYTSISVYYVPTMTRITP